LHESEFNNTPWIYGKLFNKEKETHHTVYVIMLNDFNFGAIFFCHSHDVSTTGRENKQVNLKILFDNEQQLFLVENLQPLCVVRVGVWSFVIAGWRQLRQYDIDTLSPIFSTQYESRKSILINTVFSWPSTLRKRSAELPDDLDCYDLTVKG